MNQIVDLSPIVLSLTILCLVITACSIFLGCFLNDIRKAIDNLKSDEE